MLLSVLLEIAIRTSSFWDNLRCVVGNVSNSENETNNNNDDELRSLLGWEIIIIIELDQIVNLKVSIYLSQPILLDLEAPLKICDDIHSQYYDLMRLFEYGFFPPESNYLFLGDYMDQGNQSLKSISFSLAKLNIQKDNHGLAKRLNHWFKVLIHLQNCNFFNCVVVFKMFDEHIIFWWKICSKIVF